MPDEPQRERREPMPPPTRPVTEREPLTITVIEPAVAEQAVMTPAQVEVPPRVDERSHGPSWLALGFGLAAVVMFTLWRLQFSPLVLRFEHGLQRRIVGERSYESRREPNFRGQAINR